MQPGELEAVLLIHIYHLPEDQGDRGQLGDDGRNGHAQYTQTHIADQQHIEHDIHQTGGYQRIERAAGITDGPQDPGFHVVDRSEEDAGNVDLQIPVGIRKDILRTADHTKQLPAEQDTEGSHGAADDQGEQQGGMNGITQLVIIPGPEGTGKQYRSTGRHAGKETDEQVGDRCACIDGGQCCLAHKVADDQRVHTVVEILEEIPDKDRGCELDHLSDNIALREIHGAMCAHPFPLLSIFFNYNIKRI